MPQDSEFDAMKDIRGEPARLGHEGTVHYGRVQASVHDVTGFTPNFLVLIREVRAPLDIMLEPQNEEEP